MVYQADVVVIGGGPAGLAFAIAARLRGLSVIVVDGNKPPIDKPCGEGLMPDALIALRELGVHIEVQDGYPFRGVRFSDATSAVTAEFPHGVGIGVRRPLLHAKMTERAVSVGVQLMWSTSVMALRSPEVELNGGNTISARWIVGADGSQSRVRGWAGLDHLRGVRSRFARRQHYRIAPWSDSVDVYWSDQTQAYTTAISSEEVCVVVTGPNPKRGLQDSLNEFPELTDRLRNAEAVSSERGTITSMRRLPRVTRRNIALIGDASGSVDAITGEGLSLSFRQADVLAQAILHNDLATYEREHRRLSLRPTYMARLMLLMDGRPRLRHRTLRAFQQNPQLFARLLSHHIGVTSPAHFAATGAMFGWRFLAA